MEKSLSKRLAAVFLSLCAALFCIVPGGISTPAGTEAADPMTWAMSCVDANPGSQVALDVHTYDPVAISRSLMQRSRSMLR